MTPIGGFIIAVIAGWTVRNGGRAALVVVAPWLVVLAVQTWYIAAGLGVSPPSTVTQFPHLVGYWLVQAIALALALGIAGQLGSLRARGLDRSQTGGSGRRVAIATALAAAFSAALVAAYLFAHPVFESGSVAHHSTNGQLPVLGLLGLFLSVITFAALVVTVRRRRSDTAEEPAGSGTAVGAQGGSR